MIKEPKKPHPRKTEEKRLEKAYSLMATAREMSRLYEENFKLVSRYVHSTSAGHEAIQIAAGILLEPQDFVFPYYRDESMLLAMGLEPYELMLQLMAKKDDPFSGGRSYYGHPSLRRPDFPKIPHQSSATGMQAIPATGAALGLRYLEKEGLQNPPKGKAPLVLCSLGDASITEGEVSEAFQMAALHQLPILFLIQDNEWDISASYDEIRAQDAMGFIQGFKGIEAVRLDGTDYLDCHAGLEKIFTTIRSERRPFLVHARVPLLNHHTSGVRMEWYRDDLERDRLHDPYPIFRNNLIKAGWKEDRFKALESEARKRVYTDFDKARLAPEPEVGDLHKHIFAPAPKIQESGNRNPGGNREVMVDQALHAVEELMTAHPECLLYGQDVGLRLGGVFREAATLAQKFGKTRVFNTPIQEAFIVGSTVGMSAVGLKPIVEVQFADYLWPGLNQLFTEVSRSCYLTQGKWPVSMILRVPIGAYGSGGPYHSSSMESVLTNIRGIKIVYPSNGADLKGMMKAAYRDPNPVVMLEHKGLYWSKNPGTERAKTVEPDEDYILPLGLANRVQTADPVLAEAGKACTIITYGMGVHWALNATPAMADRVEILDLRTLCPLDEEAIFASVRKTGRCMVLTEEPVQNSFGQALAGRISEACFRNLDGPVITLGAENLPAIPLNAGLEAAALPNAHKVKNRLDELLSY